MWVSVCANGMDKRDVGGDEAGDEMGRGVGGRLSGLVLSEVKETNVEDEGRGRNGKAVGKTTMRRRG